MRKKIFFALFCAISVTLFAQRGRDGSPTISTTVSVNEYTYLTADASAGNTTITVAASSLNAHGRFSGNLAPGDLILIIQMQGATLNGAIDATYGNVGLPDDSSWGGVTNYNNCGNYEFAEVSAVPSATTITLDCGLQYNYTAAGKVQIVRVQRYNSLTINSGGTITCDQWDSAIGGIIAIEVENNTIINSGGAINADSAGFRGGQFYDGADSTGWGVAWYSSTSEELGKEKGEGVGGFEWSYTQYGGKECMGAPGNGGGGGNAQNAGGGGGANGGVVANYINGFGNPNVSTADNITAWNLEYSWMSTFTSSGGGRGGYSYSANNENPLVDGPGNISAAWASDWAGDQRRSVGGRGGRPMDYSTGKIFMAGGGGAGDQNDDNGGVGGKGAGIVYLMSYGTVSGSGQIIANGENGFNSHGTATFGHAAGIDAAGGAGGGGTIIVNSVGAISGITLTANGGTGGNQVMTWDASTDEEAEGPGGGGGGGYIATSNTGLPEYTLGGANGTTNAKPMVNFLPNGATIGGAGTTDATITNFYLTAENDTICSGNTATLTATISGTAPGGTTIEWYTADSGGTAIATGPSYTTPVLTTTTTYYVGSCPGTYRIAVTVVIVGAASVSISPNTTICKGSSTNLTATGGTSYSWSPSTGLSNPAISNPVASPTTTTTYTASITTSCGVLTDSVKVTVVPTPTATISASNNPICAGQSVTITAGGGVNYTWSNSATTSSITINPASTSTITVSVSNGSCAKDTSIVITVNPVPVVTISSSSNPVCSGNPITITATGGTDYLWSNAATTSSITIIPPTGTDTYTVGISNGVCTKDTDIQITVNPTPTITISSSSNPVCSGNPITITATGGTDYSWSTTASTSSITVTPPTGTDTYTVGISNAFCTKDTDIQITVNPTPTVTISASSNPICSGNSVTISATGGNTYAWSNSASTSSITIIPPTGTDTYTVGISNGSCTKDTDIKITVNQTPTVTVTPPSATICTSASVGLTANGATSYTWTPATGLTCTTCANPTANPASTQTYTVVGNSSGCTDTTTVTVTVANTLTAVISGDTNVCAGNSTTLTASGGATYVWSTGVTSASITVSTAGNYSVVVSSGSCNSDTNVNVHVIPLPTVTISPDTTICSGSAITLTATGGGTYLWSNSSTTSSISVNPTSNTTYTAVVTKNGCSKDTSVTINTTSSLTVNITGAKPICAGDTLTLKTSGGGTYLWSPGGATTDSIRVNPTTGTTYSVTVTNGCSGTASATVNVDNPVFALCCDTIIISGNSAQLTVTGSDTGYVWSPSTGLNCTNCTTVTAHPTVTTTYTVTGTDALGCTTFNIITVIVDEPCDTLIIPNVFTPSSVGQYATPLGRYGPDNVFYINTSNLSAFSIVIFDRWGKEVYNSSNPSQYWNGNTESGAQAPSGVYYYLINATCQGTTDKKEGFVQLIR